MKLRILTLFVLLACAIMSRAGNTNVLWSATTTSNYYYTNMIVLSNALYVTQANSVSNAMYLYTNSLGASTNFAVIVPGSTTNWLRITNGVVKSITNNVP